MNTELNIRQWIGDADPAILFSHGLLTVDELVELEGEDRAAMIQRNLDRFLRDELQVLH